jgi:flagellar biosynthesis protein FlhB
LLRSPFYLWGLVIDGLSAFAGMSLTNAILYALRLIGGGLSVLIAVVLILGVKPADLSPALLFKERMKTSIQELTATELKESEGNRELKGLDPSKKQRADGAQSYDRSPWRKPMWW